MNRPLLRVYISSESYPELREIESRWEKHRTWWRAFKAALKDVRFWGFVIVLVLQWGAWWFIYRQVLHAYEWSSFGTKLIGGGALALAIVTHAWLTVTWGGDLMRPHLRCVSDIARESCPCCGHLLTSQLQLDSDRLDCPECGESIPREVFEPPYPIPRQYRAIRGWRGFRA